MIINKEVQYTKDVNANKIVAIKEYDAPLEQVWSAFTESSILDLWWAPKPWKAETKSMDFKEGGKWVYAMVGPAGERHWAFVSYKKIDKHKRFTAIDAFCDENGVINTEFPRMDWVVSFAETSEGTTVTIDITFPDEAGMQKILEMGFEQGFAMALSNLDEIFDKQ
ncbi:SRPBCC domain-containing protein [Paraflavitalea sp. CAU 1676]|uniref:SRPBCC family protein n=1 Tax=Paraflavitalea sp. CAU 1676 TaxID=3032598 RepID=UPI0023DBC406|nr:SRPBCC domain-containing protein [Paraflavitalea sp. CAU 1676]MDF2188281.1 SRPBCC domain-containing protein [Paraflavitalea sp. CAU 1676]